MEVFKTVWAQESARAKRKEIFELRAATTIKNNPHQTYRTDYSLKTPHSPKSTKALPVWRKRPLPLLRRTLGHQRKCRCVRAPSACKDLLGFLAACFPLFCQYFDRVYTGFDRSSIGFFVQGFMRALTKKAGSVRGPCCGCLIIWVCVGGPL